MNKLTLVGSLMFCVCVSYAQIFKWTDSNGVVHFSDHPHDGAKVIKMPVTQTFSPPTIPTLNNSAAEHNDKGTSKAGTYTHIAVTQPLNEATIRNNKGYLIVVAQLQPELSPGDLYQLLFDGTPIGDGQPNPAFQLNGINRGSHTLAVQVINKQGDVLITSDNITFFMHRPFVGMGNKSAN